MGGQLKQPPVSFTETFDSVFPHYLSIGMTFEQFWDGDPDTVIAYRKAEEITRERKSHEMWLQGGYVYSAILSASPILHAFAKRGTKPLPYMNEHIPVTKTAADAKAEREAKMKIERMKANMFAFMRRRKEAKQDGNNT